jgi:hypothetical protein
MQGDMSPQGQQWEDQQYNLRDLRQGKNVRHPCALRGLWSLLSFIPRFLGFLTDAFDFLLGVENLLPLGTHHILQTLLAFQKHDFSEHSWIFPADTP